MKTLKKYNLENCWMHANRFARHNEREYKYALKAFKADHADKKKIEKMIRTGKIEKAANMVQDLDTSAKDNIPDSTYDWLMSFATDVLDKEEN